MKVNFNKTEIPAISKKIIDRMLKMSDKKARIIALSGELGVGKTTLTQEIAIQLGIKENIISPTFVIMKIYNNNSSSIYHSHFKKLIHIDAYRLDNSEELLKIGWQELLDNKDNLIIVEWPERVESCLDNDTCWIKLGHIDDQTRVLEF